MDILPFPFSTYIRAASESISSIFSQVIDFFSIEHATVFGLFLTTLIGLEVYCYYFGLEEPEREIEVKRSEILGQKSILNIITEIVVDDFDDSESENGLKAEKENSSSYMYTLNLNSEPEINRDEIFHSRPDTLILNLESESEPAAQANKNDSENEDPENQFENVEFGQIESKLESSGDNNNNCEECTVLNGTSTILNYPGPEQKITNNIYTFTEAWFSVD